MKTVSVGDRVRLNSGGPMMVVVRVSGGQARCRWFVNDDELKESTFPKEALKRYRTKLAG